MMTVMEIVLLTFSDLPTIWGNVEMELKDSKERPARNDYGVLSPGLRNG